MPKLALVLLTASVGFAMPLPMTHAQTTTGTTAESEATEAWAKIKGAWTQSAGAVKEQWSKLTDDDIAEVDGRREQLIGKLQTRYGVSREDAERQVRGWEVRYR